MKDIEHLLPILRQWAAESEFVQRLWVYGSRVPGGRRAPRPDFDLDVAIEVRSTRSSPYALWRARHREWSDNLGSMIPMRLHLAHYNPAADQSLAVDDGNIKPEVDRSGYLVYDRTI
jgi:predicted nucleotidyltransferase